jgi:hypothetical protein
VWERSVASSFAGSADGVFSGVGRDGGGWADDQRVRVDARTNPGSVTAIGAPAIVATASLALVVGAALKDSREFTSASPLRGLRFR